MRSSPVTRRAFQLLACESCFLSLVSWGNIQLKWPWVLLFALLVTDRAHKKRRKAKRKICFCKSFPIFQNPPWSQGPSFPSILLGSRSHCCCWWKRGSRSCSGLQFLQPHCSTLWSILTITVHFFPSPVPLSTSPL